MSTTLVAHAAALPPRTGLLKLDGQDPWALPRPALVGASSFPSPPKTCRQPSAAMAFTPPRGRGNGVEAAHRFATGSYTSIRSVFSLWNPASNRPLHAGCHKTLRIARV